MAEAAGARRVLTWAPLQRHHSCQAPGRRSWHSTANCLCERPRVGACQVLRKLRRSNRHDPVVLDLECAVGSMQCGHVAEPRALEKKEISFANHRRGEVGIDVLEERVPYLPASSGKHELHRVGYRMIRWTFNPGNVSEAVGGSNSVMNKAIRDLDNTRAARRHDGALEDDRRG